MSFPFLFLLFIFFFSSHSCQCNCHIFMGKVSLLHFRCYIQIEKFTFFNFFFLLFSFVFNYNSLISFPDLSRMPTDKITLLSFQTKINVYFISFFFLLSVVNFIFFSAVAVVSLFIRCMHFWLVKVEYESSQFFRLIESLRSYH